ncbi:MAG: PLP-dependent aminotransferase family protein [Candidatus Acidiferrales bacterium]
MRSLQQDIHSGGGGNGASTILHISGMTTFYFLIDRNSGTPIHRQVYEGVRQAILDGRLRSGQRIPSTRGLAAELGVSRLPVLNAYDQLLHEGYLTGRVGSGTFVNSAVPDDLARPTQLATGAAPQPRTRPPTRPRSLLAGRLGPFQIGVPALDQFPHARWAGLLARHARALTHGQMAYGSPAGLMPLRAAIADHLRVARAVRCEAEQVIVVSGSQAALHLSAAVLLAPGDRVALEDPGYFGAHSALRASRGKLLPVPVDREGISVASLQRRGGRVRAVYVTPSHQYPLGVSMSAGRRFALLDWAFRRGAWVLEDDYDSEFRYVSRPLGALQGMDTHGRVIYIGTFSKAFFPAIRIGYLVVPFLLRERFLKARAAFDFSSPPLYQLALAEFLREGHFARHLRRMRGVYLERRNALLAGLSQHCANHLTIHNADAGLHVTVLLRSRIDDRAVVRRMADRELFAGPLSTCYVRTTRQNGLLLGFGASTPERLFEATRVLAEILCEAGRAG